MAGIFNKVLLFVGGYLVYKLIKRTVRGARQQARPPQQDHAQSQAQSRAQSADRVSKKKPDLDKVGEYVEFEEINK